MGPTSSGSSSPGGTFATVKASAPNTIQYLPSRPPNSQAGPRGPPSLEFLKNFANPGMDGKNMGPGGPMSMGPGGPMGPSGPMGMDPRSMGPGGPGHYGGPMGPDGPMGMDPRSMGPGMMGPGGPMGPGGRMMGPGGPMGPGG